MSRPRRSSRVFTAEGHEVFITKPCPRCRRLRPLSAFGLRRMNDGTVRDAPWCKECRNYPGRIPVGRRRRSR